MQSFFYSSNLSNFKDVLILVKDNGNGSGTGSLDGTVYTISTEYNPISAWSNVKSLVITSATTGIKSHVLLTNIAVNDQTNQNIYEAIIASADIVVTEDNRGGNYYYDPRFLLYNNINIKEPLVHLDFKIGYITKDLTFHNLHLFAGESASLIVQFKHKTILS